MELNKLLSGRFIFTVVTSLVFAYAVFTKMLTNEQIYGIIALVLSFYFGKKEEIK